MTSNDDDKEDESKWKIVPWFKHSSTKKCDIPKDSAENEHNGYLLDNPESTSKVLEPPDGGFWVR